MTSSRTNKQNDLAPAKVSLFSLKIKKRSYSRINLDNTETWFDEDETDILIRTDEPLPEQRPGENSGIFQTPTSVSSSCNLYIGLDFKVCAPNRLGLVKLITDDKRGGITQCDFVMTGSMNQLQFSIGGLRLLNEPNAGGSSVLSEALSFELLQRCFQTTLVKTEMDIEYSPPGSSKTDYVCALHGSDVAVSVTRAMKFKGTYTEEDAKGLLEKKLKGVIQSNHNAVTKWNKQILHVWAPTSQIANTFTTVFQDMDPNVKANTVVLVTTATGAPFFQYGSEKKSKQFETKRKNS